MTKMNQLSEESVLVTDKWVERFMEMAMTVASWSKDQSTQVGAVIVNENRHVIATGYNGIPRNCSDRDSSDRRNTERPYKYFWYEHAERNAIYQAARLGHSVEGCSIFVWPLYPCADCARGIIQSGIKKVYIYKDSHVDRWAESNEVAMQMFMEAEIERQSVGSIKTRSREGN